MEKDYTIRPASIHDLETLSPQVPIPPEVVRSKIEAEEFLAAERNGEMIGFIQLEYLWSKVPFIALIRVVPECRRQGVGKGLLSVLEERLSSLGHKMLYSSSQADEPEPQQWHRRVGFAECGFIAGINDGTGEIFFSKKL